MSFNTFLLALILKNPRFGFDIKSILKRSQSLAIIYTSLALILVALAYDFMTSFISGTLGNWLFTSILVPPLLVALALLRTDMQDAAATAVVCSMHIMNFFGAHSFNQPLACLYGLMLFPNFCFLLTHSWQIRALNFAFCTGQFIHHTRQVQAIFHITFDESQSIQIDSLYFSVATCLFSLCLISFVQKPFESNLWRMVESSYEKSEALTKEVLQAAQAKDAFVSSLSHEIRNPLNALSGSIDYLSLSIGDPVNTPILKNAKLSVEILMNLANNVLDAAKLRSDKMDVIYTEGNFVDTVKKVLNINSENLNSHELTVKAFIDKNIPEKLYSDQSRLLQIMMNLISNAIKFTPKEGKIGVCVTWCNKDETRENLLAPEDILSTSFTPRSQNQPNNSCLAESAIIEEFSLSEREERIKNIQLHHKFNCKFLNSNRRIDSPVLSEPWHLNYFISDQQNRGAKKGFIKVQVTDTGCGIPEESIPKLFEMFAQAHQSVNVMRGGTGLGLWICKQLIQKMGGDIKLYSRVDQGSTFTFYIPVNNNRLNEGASLSEANLPIENMAVNVLIVDDYVYNRELHKLLLQKEGATVVLANDGREAVKKYQEKPDGFFDFILMDVMMPDVDGIEAAKMIRVWETERNRKRVDINFLSGEYFHEEEILTRFRVTGKLNELDGIHCYKKPIEMSVIKDIIQKYQNQRG